MNLPTNYYKLSIADKKEVREEYIKIQNNNCYHCGEPLNGNPSLNILKKKINLSLFPKNFLKYNVHLHHNHKTGMTIGAVHSYCNAVLWQYYNE